MAEAVNKDDFNRYVDRHDHQHAELDGRLSRDMVPMPMYLSDQRATERRFSSLEQALAGKADGVRFNALETKVEAKPASTRNLLIALAGLALTLLGIVVSAYLSTHHGG